MMPTNVSLAFLIEIGKLTQVTNVTRSNRDKSPYNVHIKDKTGVLTCGQFKSVNNHSERRAKAEATLIVFHCYSVLLHISTKEASLFKSH